MEVSADGVQRVTTLCCHSCAMPKNLKPHQKLPSYQSLHASSLSQILGGMAPLSNGAQHYMPLQSSVTSL